MNELQVVSYVYFHPKYQDTMTTTILCRSADQGLRDLCNIVGFQVRPSEISTRSTCNIISPEIIQELLRTHYDRYQEKLELGKQKEMMEEQQVTIPTPLKDEQNLFNDIKKKFLW